MSAPAMSKSPDAFRTISEVADDLDIPQHVLRFWETRFSAIRPLKRGGGRRYYRPDDVELLKGIRHLLYGQGYTIKGVQRIIKEEGPRFVQGVGRGEMTIPTSPREAEPSGPAGAEWLEDGQDGAPGASGPAVEREACAARPAVAPVPMLAPPAAQSRRRLGLGSGEREALKAVLDDLLECRRILDGLKSG